MRTTIHAWDQWFLMRCPLVWQLRLHWYLPLAALWCLAMLGGWAGWMAAEPARWVGARAGVASLNSWKTPEMSTLDTSVAAVWIVSLGISLWWLLRVRIHNRWREWAPVSRLGLWREYLWGTIFFALLFAPAWMLDTFYKHQVERQWRGADVLTYERAARHVHAWDQLVAPHNSARLMEWTAVLASTSATTTKANDYALNALRWLALGDVSAITQELALHDTALTFLGYTRTGASSAQQHAQQLLAVYQASMNSALAHEWRAYKERHPTRATAKTETEESPDHRDCKNSVTPPEVRSVPSCFDAYLRMPPSEWLSSLSHLDALNMAPAPHFLRWVHPHYGEALPYRLASHLEHAVHSRTSVLAHGSHLLMTVSFGFFAALALIVVRLMSPLQMVAWCAALVLMWPSLMLAGMTDLLRIGEATWILLAILLLLAWTRIVVLRRPRGASVLLGVCMTLALAAFVFLWSELADLLLPGPAQRTDAEQWLHALMGAPAIALSTAALVAALSPLWRRWRGLPER